MRRLIAAAALVLAGLAPSVASPGIACADEGGRQAVLVVDTGPRVLRLCVELDATTVSGIHLIELAGRQHGLPYSLGFGTQAVCSLARVGVEGDDCFARYPEFWGYWRGDGDGGWFWSSSGAGGARVGDGDVEGWSWGTGDSAATHDRPPRTRLDDVCLRTPPPTPSPEPSPDLGAAQPGRDAPGASPSRSDKAEARDRATPSPSEPAATGGTDIRAAGARADDPPGGPPPAMYLAVVAIAVLVVGGRLRLSARGRAT